MKKLIALTVLAAILAFYVLHAPNDDETLPHEFAKWVAAKNYEQAVAQSIGRSRWLAPESKKAFENQFVDAIKSAGEYQYFERVGSEPIGSRWTKATYLLGFERQAVLMEFDLYKPANEWTVTGMRFYKEFTIKDGKIIHSTMPQKASE